MPSQDGDVARGAPIEAHLAVAEAWAETMRLRYPQFVWTAVDPRNPEPGRGQIVRCLPPRREPDDG